jgi:hypothetical protein
MDIELKNEWLEALRSGEYAQTTGVLKHRETDGSLSYCCLGVLAEICDIPSEIDSYFFGVQRAGCYRFVFDGIGGATNILPDEFQNKIGIDLDQTEELMAMNDEYNQSFEEIADWIEKNIKS